MPDEAVAESVTFQPFSLQHLAAVLVAALVCTTLASYGLKLRRRPEARLNERRLRLAWATSILLGQFATVAWWMLPANYDPQSSYPLHVCDLAALLAIPGLLANVRWLRTLLYFWGIGLSTQAFITPVLTVGPESPAFWLFWIQHIQIAGSGVYLIAVLGYRPRLRDVGVISLVTVVYGILMLLINLPLGLNYGYVGAMRPEQPTLIDSLGPWPLRLVPLGVLILCVYVLLWSVWPIGWAIRRTLESPRT